MPYGVWIPSRRDETSPQAGDAPEAAREPRGEMPMIFPTRVKERNFSLLVDDILPPGSLLEAVAVDALNCYINYVDLHAVITERDPEEDERYISISNQFYTHFHEFGTVVHVIASSRDHWWYFCYDIDANDCAIGRMRREAATANEILAWVYTERLSQRYPVVEIDAKGLRGWRSFQ
jgi:hypothetical protein